MLEKFKEAMGLNDEDLAEAEPIKRVDGGFEIDGDCCFAWWSQSVAPGAHEDESWLL